MTGIKLFLSQKPTVDELVRFIRVQDCTSLFSMSSRFATHFHNIEFHARALDYSWSEACRHGSIAVVKWLHRNNIAPDCRAECLNYAIRFGHLQLVQFLLENNLVNFNRYLMCEAVKYGHLDLVKYFYDQEGWCLTISPWDCAIEGGYLDVLKWLHENIIFGGRVNVAYRYPRHKIERLAHLHVAEWLAKNDYVGS